MSQMFSWTLSRRLIVASNKIRIIRERKRETENTRHTVSPSLFFRSYSFLFLSYKYIDRTRWASPACHWSRPIVYIYIYLHIHTKRCHSVYIASLFTVYHDWISSSVTFFFSSFSYLLSIPINEWRFDAIETSMTYSMKKSFELNNH
jgi:hypothetical protein